LAVKEYIETLKKRSGVDNIQNDSDAIWATPWEWRDEKDTYFGRNGQAWMYRAFPMSPLLWEDHNTQIAIGDQMANFLHELGSTSLVYFSGVKNASRNREIHIVSTSWERPTKPPVKNSSALQNLQRSFLGFDSPERMLVIGVRLWPDTLSRDDLSAMNQLKSAVAKLLLEDVPNRKAYAKDQKFVESLFQRYGSTQMTQAQRNQLESWFNKGEGPQTTVIERMKNVEVLNHKTFEISAVMSFNTPMLNAPAAHWMLESKSHESGPTAVSIRAELEPSIITRDRTRRSQRAINALLEEEQATGDLERPEFSQAYQQAKAFEDYIIDSKEPLLTKCSILFAREADDYDETFMDLLRNDYGIDAKPLEHRQIRALDEFLPTSGKRANPFLQDVSISMLAHAGLNGFANLGDKEGLYVGVAAPDYTPVFLDPKGAAKNHKPAAMLIAGDSGSGKSFLSQTLAIQAAVGGETTIFINPKGFDSLEGMAEFVGGTVVKMSALEGKPGAFDPFRYAPGPVAAEIATNHITGVLGSTTGFTQQQQLDLGSGLKTAAEAGARCVGEAFPFMKDKMMVEQIKQQVSSSSLFALGVALEPLEKFGSQAGLTLIEFDRKLDLPDPAKSPESYTRGETIALSAVRLVTRASIEILMLSKGGVLVMDEAWTFLGYPEGLGALQQLGREGRSLGILPIFATQRVADVVSRDMESYLSRVFCLKNSDERDATVALQLCGLEPTPARIAWLKTCGPREGTDGGPGRPAMSIHRDINDRHSAVMIWPVPQEISDAIRTDYSARQAKENKQ